MQKLTEAVSCKMASATKTNLGMLTDREFDVQLRQMVDNAELSDVTFLCEDGIQVHGCSILLAARCPFFKELLFGETRELRNPIVELPTVSSSILILIMKFLYTGKLVPEDLNPVTLTILPSDKGDDTFQVDRIFLLRVAVTARYFMLGDLEKVITDLLSDDLLRGDRLGEDSLLQLAKAFSVIHEDPTLSMVRTSGAICALMAATLSTHVLSPATLSNLSEAAFNSYLEKTRPSSGQENRTGFDEYLRIRQILTWCAAFGSATENLDRTCLPGPEVALNFILSSDHEDSCSKAAFDFSRGRKCFMNRIAKESLKPLLKYVDFTCVPTKLFCSVIEPLDIIELGELATIFRTQAMRKFRQRREDMAISQANNIWQLAAGSDNMRRIASGDDKTLILTVERETSSFTVAAFASLLMYHCDTVEWEISITPQGYLARRSMENFEFGFRTINYENTWY